MSISSVKPSVFDPFGFVSVSLNGWSSFLGVALELRDVDNEMMDTMLETCVAGSGPPAPNAKTANLLKLMASLKLDPESIRLKDSLVERKLAAACLGCTERSRCNRELRSGTLAESYSKFCPNAASLDRLRHA